METQKKETLHWRIQRAFNLELTTARRRNEAALWEVRNIRKLIPSEIPIIVLKGCAYALANDRNAAGRMFSDIDLMVDADHLEKVESALISGGWKPSQVSAYDQKYYREWMHEIPPMEHVRRRTTVDLHHAIIPIVSRFAFPAQQLIAAAIEILPGVFILSPADRIIHSSVHAFLEGVPTKALRDIYDITCLMKQHYPDQPRPEELLVRAGQLGLEQLLMAALEASEIIFGKHVRPRHQTVKHSLRGRCLAVAAQSPLKPGQLLGNLMAHALLAHSHWMKMPWYLLIPHLARKAWIGLTQKNTAT
ncbi:MAG: hypothetical protein H6R13_1429 [Proteobacteria bacterium]|nr:hypothetical protein [Pseudomonadota bacterium]